LKPVLKMPGVQFLGLLLKYEVTASRFAFTFNSRPYIKAIQSERYLQNVMLCQQHHQALQQLQLQAQEHQAQQQQLAQVHQAQQLAHGHQAQRQAQGHQAQQLAQAGRLLRTNTRPTLNRRTEAAHLHEQSPCR